jgi:hypothetical protein
VPGTGVARIYGEGRLAGYGLSVFFVLRHQFKEMKDKGRRLKKLHLRYHNDTNDIFNSRRKYSCKQD